MQRGDFVELFEIMEGLPVTIRLLDPPLHEFLPHGEEEIAEVAAAMGVDPKKLAHRAKELHEFNPMLGFRGCRIAIAYPEIAEMQARAIFEAAVEAGKRTGKPVVPEVMVPLIATKAELDIVKARIDAMAQAVMKETGAKLDYQVGTMIELPRAALMADEIAQSAEFFSFGTNDLTQTTFGISRDDAASLPRHLHRSAASCRAIRSCRSTARASASWCGSASSAAARCARSSRSASAASTAATRRRSRSATRSGSTTCPARRSACRSRGLPRRRRRSARRPRARRKRRRYIVSSRATTRLPGLARADHAAQAVRRGRDDGPGALGADEDFGDRAGVGQALAIGLSPKFSRSMRTTSVRLPQGICVHRLRPTRHGMSAHVWNCRLLCRPPIPSEAQP